MSTLTIEDARQGFASRMKKLEPAVREHERLAKAQAALEAVVGRPARAVRRSSARPPVKVKTRGRRGRPPGSGKRAQEAFDLLASAPEGLTIPEMARAMKIQPNYLYRVLPGLREQGKVIHRKADKRWFRSPGGQPSS
jgi:hypothetical protein